MNCNPHTGCQTAGCHVVKHISEGGLGSVFRSVNSNTVSAPLRCFFEAVLSRRQAVEVDLTARYTLRRNTSSQWRNKGDKGASPGRGIFG